MTKGIIVTATGLDLSGKDTLIEAIANNLKEQGKKVLDIRKFTELPSLDLLMNQDVIVSCEPTYFEIGKFIREEVIASNERYYSARQTATYFSDDRLFLFSEVVAPTSEKGITNLIVRGRID